MKLPANIEHVLDFIVRDYTQTATPISSQHVAQRTKTKASTATIRNIMRELDEDGFLFQPHTSAGRIPTEAGYRYFVKYCMEERDPPLIMKKEMDAIVYRLAEDTDALFDELSHVLARELKLFSGAGVVGKSAHLFGCGLAEVFQEPEFGEHQETIKFGKFIDSIDKEFVRSRCARATKDTACDVSIGKFGMVTAFAESDLLGECVAFSAGPQRMNYEKASAFLKYTIDDIISVSDKLKKT